MSERNISVPMGEACKAVAHQLQEHELLIEYSLHGAAELCEIVAKEAVAAYLAATATEAGLIPRLVTDLQPTEYVPLWAKETVEILMDDHTWREARVLERSTGTGDYGDGWLLVEEGGLQSWVEPGEWRSGQARGQ